MPHLTEELAERLSFPPRPGVVAEGAQAQWVDRDLSTATEEEAAGPESKPRRKSQFVMNQRLGGPISLSGSPEEVAAAQAATSHLYDTVRAARNLHAEYQIATNKPARFILRLREDLLEDAGGLASTVRALTRMINAEELTLAPDYLPPRGTPQVLTPLGDLFMPLAGLVDVAAERGADRKGAGAHGSRVAGGATEIGQPAIRRERTGGGSRGTSAAAGDGGGAFGQAAGDAPGAGGGNGSGSCRGDSKSLPGRPGGEERLDQHRQLFAVASFQDGGARAWGGAQPAAKFGELLGPQA